LRPTRSGIELEHELAEQNLRRQRHLLHNHRRQAGAAELGEQAVQVVQAERRLAGRAPRSKRRTFGRDVIVIELRELPDRAAVLVSAEDVRDRGLLHLVEEVDPYRADVELFSPARRLDGLDDEAGAGLGSGDEPGIVLPKRSRLRQTATRAGHSVVDDPAERGQRIAALILAFSIGVLQPLLLFAALSGPRGSPRSPRPTSASRSAPVPTLPSRPPTSP